MPPKYGHYTCTLVMCSVDKNNEIGLFVIILTKIINFSFTVTNFICYFDASYYQHKVRILNTHQLFVKNL